MLTIHSDEELNPIQFNEAMTELEANGIAGIVTGWKYKVTFNDCCVNGWFIDRLKYVHFVLDRDRKPRLDYLRFENAEVRLWSEIDKVDE